MTASSKTEHEKAIERIMIPPPPPPNTGGKKRRWSKDDLDFLKKMYHKKTKQYMAEKLGRTEAAIHRYAGRIGITEKYISWSSQEEILLKDLWSKKSPSDIAKIIGRSVPAITIRASKLGLSDKNK